MIFARLPTPCVLFLFALLISPNDAEIDINCRSGQKWLRARSYTHLISTGSSIDASGDEVRPLENFLEGKSTNVSVGVDRHIFDKFPELPICIPEINRKYKTLVKFLVKDVVPDFEGSGFTKIVIMIRDSKQSTEHLLNNYLTVVLY